MLRMFNLFFRRQVPGFRVGPDGVPGFDIDDGLPRRATAGFIGADIHFPAGGLIDL
jgi:hypothetical protein